MTKVADNYIVVPICGDLSYATVPGLSKSNRILIRQNPKINFDLSQVTSSDNAGVALLVALAGFAKGLQKEISFINLPQQLLDLLIASGLKEILPIG